MNTTNRGLNRVILFIVGVVLLAGGGAVTMAVFWPVAGDAWNTSITSAVDAMVSADNASRISSGSSVSWLSIGLLALLLLIVVIAALIVTRLGGGRSSVVVRDEEGSATQGAVTVRSGFASDAITNSLAQHDEILSSRVNSRRLHGEDVLHVSVTPRQNVSPVEVAGTVSKLVDNLATLVGRQTPTLVSIRSDIRSRLAADQPRVN